MTAYPLRAPLQDGARALGLALADGQIDQLLAYLDLLADLEWNPGIRYLQPEDTDINRFAFVIHPLSLRFIHKHPLFWFTRYLPDRRDLNRSFPGEEHGSLASQIAYIFRTEIVESGALPTALNWYRALPFTDLRASRGKVDVPTTFIWSDGDIAIGRWGAEHSGEYVTGDYEYVELAGVSHWIPTQAADACAQAILDRVRG